MGYVEATNNAASNPTQSIRSLGMNLARNINSPDMRHPTRWTALHLGTILSPKEQAIRLLLEAGADPHVRNAAGETPLKQAWRMQTEHPYCDYSKVITLLEEVSAARRTQ